MSMIGGRLAEKVAATIEEMLSTDFKVATKVGRQNAFEALKDLSRNTYYVGILSKISAPVEAYALIIADTASADEIVVALTGDHIFNFDEFKQSAVQELGNILIGSFSSQLSKELGTKIDYTIPLVAVDQPTALIDAVTAIVSEKDCEQIEMDFFSAYPPIAIKLVIFKDGD